MSGTNHTQHEQATLWNGRAGRAWVDAQQVLDSMLKPFEDHLVRAASARSLRRVLDIGCGTGTTTLAVARALGGGAECVGIDISEPMLAMARSRAEREGARAQFIRADAQSYAFEPMSFDMLISRFGVMFFADPVAAFSNLRRATTRGAELRLVVFRAPAENPFMTAAERAAAPFLPALPARAPDAPGQFAFADPHKVRRILEQSGWAEIDIQPLDVTCKLPEADLLQYVTRLGPVGMVLQDVDEVTRARITQTVRAAFDPYVHGTEVRFEAACWTVGARSNARASE